MYPTLRLPKMASSSRLLTVRDQEKSKNSYVRILGGKLMKLGNSWIILNSGGGPTRDNSDITLEARSDLIRVNSFLNLRVADIWACYELARQRRKGAIFLTEPPDDHGWDGLVTRAIPTA